MSGPPIIEHQFQQQRQPQIPQNYSQQYPQQPTPPPLYQSQQPQQQYPYYPIQQNQGFAIGQPIQMHQSNQYQYPMAQPVMPIQIYQSQIRTYTRNPQPMMCPVCQSQVISRVDYVTGGGTWFICFIIALIFWPLCFVPFCVEDCKDVIHYCPNCGAEVGSKRFLFN